jgi:hypothetical protein
MEPKGLLPCLQKPVWVNAPCDAAELINITWRRHKGHTICKVETWSCLFKVTDVIFINNFEFAKIAYLYYGRHHACAVLLFRPCGLYLIATVISWFKI